MILALTLLGAFAVLCVFMEWKEIALLFFMFVVVMAVTR